MGCSYRYTKRPLLRAEPVHYHYTPFEGAAFLSAYQAERCRFLSALDAAAAGTEDADEDGSLARAIRAWPDGTATPGASPADDAAFPPPTLDQLRRLAWAAVRPAAGGTRAAPAARTDAFLRKFEFAKRLRAAYGPDLKPLTREAAPLDAYALLAFLVAAGLPGPAPLRALNALLKLCDLVVSHPASELGCSGRAAAHVAVSCEMQAVAALGAAHGLTVLAPSGGGRRGGGGGAA